MATQKKIVLTAEDRTKGAFRGVQRNMGKLESATAGLQKAFALLAGATGLALVARSFINAADRAVQLENKLKLVTNTSQDLTRVYGKLFKLSKDTRVSFEATSELYARLARSSDHLGLSEEQLLQITESLNQAFAVSGAGIMETASAVRQLGQGLASGRLAGDELRSIMENAPRVAKMIADGMDTSIGQLRRLGSEGKLNAESVTEAILKMGPEVQAEFEKTAGTVGQATTAMSDSWMNFVNVVDDTTGATGGLAKGITFFSQTLDNMAESLEQIANPETAGLKGLTKAELRQKLQETTQSLLDVSGSIRGIKEELKDPSLFDIAMGNVATQNVELIGFMNQRNTLQQRHSAILKEIASIDMSAVQETTEKTAKTTITWMDELEGYGNSMDEYNEDLALMKSNYLDLADGIEVGTLLLGKQLDAIEATKTAFANLREREWTGFNFKDPNTAQEELRNQWKERMTVIQNAYALELMNHDEYLQEKERAEKDYHFRVAVLQTQSASNYVGNLASMASATKDMSVEAFELWKALAIAQATMNAFLTYTKVLQDPLIPTPLAHGIGVTMMGLSLAYASKISSMNYPKREYGGSVTRGQTYLVGERGPELFTANQSGNITPNNQIGGTTNVNFSINTVDARNFDNLLQARRGVIIGMINQAMNRSGQAGLI